MLHEITNDGTIEFYEFQDESGSRKRVPKDAIRITRNNKRCRLYIPSALLTSLGTPPDHLRLRVAKNPLTGEWYIVLSDNGMHISINSKVKSGTVDNRELVHLIDKITGCNDDCYDVTLSENLSPEQGSGTYKILGVQK